MSPTPNIGPNGIDFSTPYWKDELKKIFRLLDQMIEKKEFDDKKENKDGESWDLHHLKLLRQMMRDLVGPFEAE